MEKIFNIAVEARNDLGDDLTNQTGENRREAGRLEEQENK